MEIRLDPLCARCPCTPDVHGHLAHLAVILVMMAGFAFSASTAQAAIQKPPNNLGLVGYWSMDDCRSTRATDLSGQGNHGTLSGFAYTGTTSNWLSGANAKRGCALAFDGTDDYVDTGDVAALNSASAFAISGWAKQTTLDQSRWIFGKSTANCVGSSNCITMETYSDGYLYAEVRNGGASYGYLDYSQYVTAGTWFHYTVVFDGSQSTNATRLKLYIDGVQRTLTYVGTIPATTGNLSGRSFLIGQSDAGGVIGMWNGSIDEVRVYNRVLGATEVRNLYNAGVTKVSGASTEGVDDGLVGHWKLDDRTGTRALDSTRYANHGTLTNFALSGATSNWASGYRGGAVTFDGTDDVVTVPDANQLDITSAITLAAWIKPNGATEDGHIVSKNNTGNLAAGYSLFWYGSTDRLQFLANDDCGVTNCVSDAVFTDDNVWVHVAVVANGSTATFYRNGVAAGTLSSTELPPANALAVTLGNRTGGATAGAVFGGSIDDVRIYNTALTAEQIKALYTLGTTKPTLVNIASNRLTTGTNLASGLVGHWTFDGRYLNTTTARDTSGQANHGTLTNGPVPIMGKLGQALTFDGTNDYVEASVVGLPVGSSTRTVSLWFNANSYASKNMVGWGGDGTNVTFDIILYGGTVAGHFYWYDSIIGAPPFTTGVWNHAVMTYDGSILRLYLNGALRNTTTIALNTGSSNLYMGKGAYGAFNSYNGSLDDVRVYNRALSAAEVQQLYNLGR